MEKTGTLSLLKVDGNRLQYYGGLSTRGVPQDRRAGGRCRGRQHVGPSKPKKFSGLQAQVTEAQGASEKVKFLISARPDLRITPTAQLRTGRGSQARRDGDRSAQYGFTRVVTRGCAESTPPSPSSDLTLPEKIWPKHATTVRVRVRGVGGVGTGALYKCLRSRTYGRWGGGCIQTPRTRCVLCRMVCFFPRGVRTVQ